MKLRELAPSLRDDNDEDFITNMRGDVLSLCLNLISEYYSRNLPLHKVLSHQGQYIDPSQDEANIHCLWDSHGGPDNSRSGKYYAYSHTNGKEDEASCYCFKCDSRKTVFWHICATAYLTREEHDVRTGMRICLRTYKVPPPRDLLLDFDFDEELTLDSPINPRKQMIRSLVLKGDRLRSLKGTDTQEYLRQLRELNKERV